MKKTSFYVLSAFILITTSLSATSNEVLFKSGTVEYAANAQTFADNPVINDEEVFENRVYKLIQFNELPGSTNMETLKGLGVNFLSYMPKNAYLASFPTEFNFNSLLDYNIKGIYTVKASQKTHPWLSSKNVPDYAIVNDNIVGLTLKPYEDIDFETVKIALEADGITIMNYYDNLGLIDIAVHIDDALAVAALPYVSYLEFIYPEDPENYTGRTLHRSNGVASDYPAGRHYDGTGINIMMQDDGLIGPHIDYEGRLDQTNSGGSSGNHGDHVAGIIMGAGNLDPIAKGMAFGSFLHVYNSSNANYNDVPAIYVSDDVVITSKSYGNGCNAGYTTLSAQLDEQIIDYPSLQHVFSTGNSGGSDCGYGAGSGWGNITGGHKQGKNVIAVGNLNYTSGVAGSSSRGPADDGRIKPDICAKGSSVNSTIDVNTYASFSGTSMACPGVAGSLGQIYQAYKAINGGTNPPSGLIKCAILNGADDLGNPGPDFTHGWGEINVMNAVQTLEDTRYIQNSVDHGVMNTHNITVPSGLSHLKIMVYWVDYQGTAGSAISLVNDLNMQVNDGSSTYDPWILDPTPVPANLSSNATRGVDDLNNMEQVTLNNPSAGSYTITVDGFSVGFGPQEYFITYEYYTNDVELTYPLGGESWVPGETETIRWDAFGTSGTFTLAYSQNGGSTWTNIASGINSSRRYYDWTVPSIVNEDTKIRVTRGGSSDQSPANFSIINVPTGLAITANCSYYYELQWSAVSGASDYDIWILGEKYMDHFANTTATSYQITCNNPLDEDWVSVSANSSSGAEGRRAVAIQKPTTLFGCSSVNDITINSVSSPPAVASQDCNGNVNLSVTIEIANNGSSNESNFPVRYQLNGGTVVTGTHTGSITSGGGTSIFTFSTPITSTIGGTNNLVIWTDLSTDGGSCNDTIETSFTVIPATVINLPYSEDFESFSNCGTTNNCELEICNLINGWTNELNGSTDDIDWRTHNGSTPSRASGVTGPTVDHNPGNVFGKYLYTEASAGCSFREAQITSPCIDLTTTANPEFSYWYHMAGSDMGDMHFDVFNGTSWDLDVAPVVSGNQGDVWNQQIVNLSAYNGSVIKVRVRGVTGGDWQSDMAIDDINIQDNISPPSANFNNTSGHLCINQPVTFTDAASGSAISSYSWNFGAGAIPATATTAGPHMVTYSTTGVKTVTYTVSNVAGPSTQTRNITINPLPTANFSFVTSAASVSFTNSSIDGDTYIWHLGDGASVSDTNTFHTYATSGTYNVMLIAQNACGNDTLSQMVSVTVPSPPTPTDIVGLDGEYNVNIYPNPNDGLFSIEVPEAFIGNSTISVYDAQGKVVKKVTVNTTNQILDLRPIAKGVYLVEIVNDNHSVKAKLVVE